MRHENRLACSLAFLVSFCIYALRVADYSREIARRYGWDEEQAEKIWLIGLLHDIGKIGIPDSNINKPTRLTDEEYQITKQHPD